MKEKIETEKHKKKHKTIDQNCIHKLIKISNFIIYNHYQFDAQEHVCIHLMRKKMLITQIHIIVTRFLIGVRKRTYIYGYKYSHRKIANTRHFKSKIPNTY